jgi:cytidylate kinase
MSQGFIVAIDGTAGSGKSTTARLAAKALGFLHIDTGAMYRAVTLKVMRTKTDLNDLPALRELLEATRIEFRSGVPAHQAGSRCASTPHVILDGEDVTQAIREQAVDKLVSPVSAIPLVRQRLVAEQRRIADGRQVVCEGRDITSVVFPDADLKFYVDADIAARVNRRQAELKHKGVTVAGKAIIDNLSERDYIDSTRTHSPLTRVKDSIYLDTTNLTIEEEVMIVVDLARMRLERKQAAGGVRVS